MQIEVKELEPCRLSVQYTADAGEILNKRGEILGHFKKAPVPGFRQGKATPQALQMHYRTQIDDAVKRSLAEDAFHNTLFEKKIKPHGAPRFNNVFLGDGKFTCEFDLHTKPEFELPEYSGLKIPKPHQEQTDVEVTERMLQELRVRVGNQTPYGEDDVVEPGDNVIMDYEGFLGDVRQENLCATGEMITVGNSNFSQFDDNVLGMRVGETREFDVLVPESGLPSVAGKTVRIKATLNVGSKVTPFPLDDTLAQRMGKATLDELREQVRGSAVASLQAKEKSTVTEAIAQQLVTSTTMEVPNWMALSEAQYLAHNSKIDWATMADEDRERYLDMGSKNVKLSLILDRIREVEPEAQLTDQETFDVIKRNLANTNITTDINEVIAQMNKTGYLQILFSRIRDEHTMDFIVKTVQFIE